MIRRALSCLALAATACWLVACSSTGDATVRDEGQAQARPAGEPGSRGPAPPDLVKEIPSAYLDQPLMVFEGMFSPLEAEACVLPFMAEYPQLFAGKRVFEIGTGSGIISLYAAQLGASKVVCTDIDPRALDSVRRNAERMGFADVIEARLVPDSDEVNTTVVDRGDLGFSIVRGLEQRLAPEGMAVLLYNTLFYHGVMVKFARYRGYEVRSHTPSGMSPYAFNALFNLYLERLLEHEQLPADAFRFERSELPYAIVFDNNPEPGPLVGESQKAGFVYRGLMTIRR